MTRPFIFLFIFIFITTLTIAIVDSNSTPNNPFGIGLVDSGSDTELDLASTLSGNGGKVLLIFAGITRQTTAADPAWTAALQGALKRNLVPVVRLNAPWGQSNIRDSADDVGTYHNYTTLAGAYAKVVGDVMRQVPGGWFFGGKEKIKTL